MKRYLFALLLAIAPASLSIAADPNYYDQQEAIRRAVEHVQKRDREERAAAKQRADEKERELNRTPSEPTSPVTLFIFYVCAAAFVYFLMVRPIYLAVREYFEDTPAEKRRKEREAINRKLEEEREAERQQQEHQNIQAEREKQAVEMAGQALTEIVNGALERGMQVEEIQCACRENWRVHFTVEEGKLNVTRTELLRASAHIQKMREAFNVPVAVAEQAPRYWKLF